MTTYHPILFNSEMVKAILDSRKTQTRRVVKSSLDFDVTGGRPERREQYDFLRLPNGDEVNIKSPYGRPGDRLWVRETWAVDNFWDATKPRDITPRNHPGHGVGLRYMASDKKHEPLTGKTRPSIFMPRWASRITLGVTAVRVERVQDITGVDVLAEGIDPQFPPSAGYERAMRMRFAALWDSINDNPPKRPYGWDVNPWVWVVDFKVIKDE